MAVWRDETPFSSQLGWSHQWRWVIWGSAHMAQAGVLESGSLAEILVAGGWGHGESTI